MHCIHFNWYQIKKYYFIWYTNSEEIKTSLSISCSWIKSNWFCYICVNRIVNEKATNDRIRQDKTKNNNVKRNRNRILRTLQTTLNWKGRPNREYNEMFQNNRGMNGFWREKNGEINTITMYYEIETKIAIHYMRWSCARYELRLICCCSYRSQCVKNS